MELIEGQTLGEYLRLNGPLTVRAALPLVENIAAGLQAVHDAGIIHGDLKPGNVMLVTRPGETAPHAIVMDFGMALPNAPQSAPSRDGAMSGSWSSHPDGDASRPTPTLAPAGPVLRGGTPDFFAPEQAAGEPSSTATDVYAFALVIGEMLGLPRAERLQPDSKHMPSGCARVLRRALDADSRRRYARPADLATAFRAALERPARNMRRAALATCAALALLVAAQRIDTRRGTANRLVLTEGGGLEVRAASPDGKLFAATSWDTGDLILKDVGSGKSRRLTHKTTTWQQQFGGVYGAVFSPDGRRIAYEWNNSRTDHELRVIGADGKGERTLYHAPDNAISLFDWSPDGGSILASVGRISEAPQLALVSPQDGSVRILPRQPSLPWSGNVRFGLDRNSIVFDTQSGNGSAFEIHRLTVDGTESTLLANAGHSSIMGWSPDRHQLVFVSDRRGHPGVWGVQVSERGAEGEPRELVTSAVKWDVLGISRSGSLFYRYDGSATDVYTAVLDLAAGRTVSPPRRVTERYVGISRYPAWSEDGSRLAFDSARDPSTQRLAIYDSAAGRLRELSLDLAYSWRPQWIEHGAAIMVVGKAPDGREGQFRVDARSGEVTLFRTGQELESMVEGVWSHDGRYHFNRFADFRRGIFRLDVTTGERRILYVPPAGTDVATENLALSPDGRTLAFHARNGTNATSSLMLVPSDGGEARPLLTIHRPEVFLYGSFTWTPDSKTILSARTREAVSEIWRVPVDGSAPAKIDFPPMFVACLRLNPDGKTIAFQVAHSKGEIWVMQNFL
jgi:Tol biopolymer transport system component